MPAALLDAAFRPGARRDPYPPEPRSGRLEVKVRKRAPVSAAQTRAVASRLAVARYRPSGDRIEIVEITLRTAAGLEAIRRLAGLAGMHVGAGTVLMADQVNQVVRAGARFVVSPGLSVDVVTRCRALDVHPLPGVATATDLMTATALALDEVKFFPADLLGGPPAIRALAAPFTGMTFLPSGGVQADNMADYLGLRAVPAVSGSWIVEPALLRAGRWDEVRARAAAAVERAARVGAPRAAVSAEPERG